MALSVFASLHHCVISLPACIDFQSLNTMTGQKAPLCSCSQLTFITEVTTDIADGGFQLEQPTQWSELDCNTAWLLAERKGAGERNQAEKVTVLLSADANIYLSAEVTGCWAILWQLTAAVWLFSAVCETNLTTEHHFTTGTQWFVFKSVICIVLAAFGGQLGRLACFHWSYLWKIRTHIHTDDEGDCSERRIQCLLSHTVNFELCGRNINPANDNKPRHSHYTVSVYRLSILIIACTVNSAPSKFFLLTLSPGTLIKSSLHW